MRGRASGRANSRGVGARRGVRGQSAGSSRTHVIQNGRRGDVAHDRPGAHDGCGVRELPPIMLAAREGSSELRRRRSRRRQRAESAVVGRGRERRRRHYGQERRHRRMCRGRHGDDPVQESSSHRSQTTSTFGRQISSQPKQRPHTAPQQLVLSGCGESRPPSVRWGSTWGGACGMRGTLPPASPASVTTRPAARADPPRALPHLHLVEGRKDWRNESPLAAQVGKLSVGKCEFTK